MTTTFIFHRSVLPEDIHININQAPDLTDLNLNDREGRALANALYDFLPVATLAVMLNTMLERAGLMERVDARSLMFRSVAMTMVKHDPRPDPEIAAPWQDPEAPNG